MKHWRSVEMRKMINNDINATVFDDNNNNNNNNTAPIIL